MKCIEASIGQYRVQCTDACAGKIDSDMPRGMRSVDSEMLSWKNGPIQVECHGKGFRATRPLVLFGEGQTKHEHVFTRPYPFVPVYKGTWFIHNQPGQE